MLNTIILNTTKKFKFGDVVPLSRGYARYLIKEGRVLADTAKNKNIAEKILQEENKKRAEKLNAANILAEKLKKEQISFLVTQYNGNGTLFGAIKVPDIIMKLHKLSTAYHNIKNNNAFLNNPIKVHGTYFLTINLYEIDVKIPIFIGKSDLEIKKMQEEYNNLINPVADKEETEEIKKEGVKNNA